jgi:hypothetical protein
MDELSRGYLVILFQRLPGYFIPEVTWLFYSRGYLVILFIQCAYQINKGNNLNLRMREIKLVKPWKLFYNCLFLA